MINADDSPHYKEFQRAGNHFECVCCHKPIAAADLLLLLFNRLEELEEYVYGDLPEVPPGDGGSPMAPPG